MFMPITKVCSTGTICSSHNFARITKSHQPANSTFFTMIWIFVFTGEMLTDGTEIGGNYPSTLLTLGTVFTNL